jgi:hypothetical protein
MNKQKNLLEGDSIVTMTTRLNRMQEDRLKENQTCQLTVLFSGNFVVILL